MGEAAMVRSLFRKGVSCYTCDTDVEEPLTGTDIIHTSVFDAV